MSGGGHFTLNDGVTGDFMFGTAAGRPRASQEMVPSRFMLELTGASSGDMRLSDHAARSMI